jgi:hypothetical protein
VDTFQHSFTVRGCDTRRQVFGFGEARSNETRCLVGKCGSGVSRVLGNVEQGKEELDDERVLGLFLGIDFVQVEYTGFEVDGFSLEV